MTEKVTIYHNPNCGTSRNVLAMIRHAGIEPEIIEYLQTPPSREELVKLINQMEISVRSLLRTNVSSYEAYGLIDEAVTDEHILDAMIAEPILINRPIVVTNKGAKLCRPSEEVLVLLPEDFPYPFTKEDGEVIAK